MISFGNLEIELRRGVGRRRCHLGYVERRRMRCVYF
jgi:hypothetical protein